MSGEKDETHIKNERKFRFYNVKKKKGAKEDIVYDF